ncbi:MAG: BamA/TamA family outer membrane protein [Myxococcales bacterium]|nr:BamA/TamA family outer membrane protein [Myxococcales bacterium]MCB9754233.1 BamA/TamA family outer membrane protein [Myxococcales bacterium]
MWTTPHRRRAGLLGHALAVAVAASAAQGCAGKARAPDRPPGPVIREVEVKGVTAFEQDEFLSYLNLQPTPRLSLKGKRYYVPGLEKIDEERIKELYAAHGYHDARAVSIDVEVETKGDPERHARKVERRARRGKPPPKPLKKIARATIVVDEGLPAKVRDIEITWERVPSDPAFPVDRAKIEQEVTLAVGDAFSIPALGASAMAMQRALEAAGYPHAKVSEQAAVHRRERWAELQFTVDPGAPARIGEIKLEGLKFVPPDLVQREIDYARGKPYRPALVTRVEKTIYGMDVFSTVSVTKGPPKDDGTIDLIAKMQESRLQSVKVGGGVGIDPVRWEQRVSLRYRHESIFGRLTRMDVIARAGYAELPNFWAAQQHGPILKLDLIFRKKGLLEKHLIWTEHPGFELGIWEGYQFWNVTNTLGVTRFITRFVELGLSYNNLYQQLFNLTSALQDPDNRALLGPDFRERFFLSYLEAGATLHLTDDLIAPTNGARLSLTYDLSNRYIGSQFNYHKFSPELRLYWKPHNRVQLAGRARVGLLFPYGEGDRRAVPLSQRLYLGGANDVRGWPLRRLSPRVRTCGGVDLDGNLTDCDQAPVGGYSEVLMNAELRVRLVAELWAAGFYDLGDIREGVAEFDPRGWQHSTGGGLRYNSPIGIFRLDFGWRLTTDEARFPEPRRWAIHFSLGEAF